MWFLFRRSAQPAQSARRSPPSYRPCLEVLEDRLCPSGGVLDPTFGGGTGQVSFPWATSNIATSVAIQPKDGKIVSVGDVTARGSDTNEISIIRMNSDGSLDKTFNSTGIVDLKIGVYADAGSVAIQPDGKILVGGTAYSTNKAYQGFDSEIAIARYNANGTLDTTFANKGIFTWNRLPSQDSASSLTVLPDNSIVAIAATNSINSGGAIFKLSANGSPVNSFGNNGVATFQPIQGTQLTDMTVAPNGDLILSGYTYYNRVGLLFAVNPSTGTLDPSFNNGQGWLEDVNPVGTFEFDTVAVQGNNIVVGGSSYITGQGGYGMLARFSLNTGTLDPSFNNTGYFVMSTTGGNFNNVAFEPDGSLIAEGPVENGYLTVAHFTANGQLDTTFGGAGTGFAVITGAEGFGLAIDASGRIVVSGHDGPNVTGQRMAFFARLTPPEAMIGSFTASPNPVSSGTTTTLTASNFANSSTITQVAIYLDSNNDGTLEPGTDTLLGYATQTSPGVWTLTNSSAFGLTAGTYTLFAQAEDSDGVFGDPDALTLTVT